MVRVMMRFGRKDVGFDEKLILFGSGGETNERRRKKRKGWRLKRKKSLVQVFQGGRRIRKRD